MKFKTMLTATVASLALALPAFAASYNEHHEGDAEVNWEFDFEETAKFTVNSGAEFNFNGGAGTEGDALAKGDFTGVGGIFAEEAWGTGDAYSNTNGNNFAKAEFHSAAFNANGGFAADLEFGDPAKISYDGTVMAGGAGAVETGLSTGWTSEYSQTGSFSGSYEANKSGHASYHH